MIYDVSMSITYDMTVYKNKDEKRPLIKKMADFPSSGIYESRIDMDLHTGTHVDAALHVLENGSKIENLTIDRLLTKCKVFDLTNIEGKIAKADLENKPIGEGDFILFKTQNSLDNDCGTGFVYLDASGAEYLQEKGINGVGIDGPGIERNQPGHPTHKTLLGNGSIIMEGLRLGEVEEGEYILIALPLKIINAEASPVRAVLLDREEINKF